ncbi:NAD-dependent epimerase/dehydratase family protein [Pantoea sp.]|uniref:NAD-dependent epimerase/dehydratase family protein n=1 Tax=Pantoea sp. TaxID=69393 RepID=UPI0031DEE97E
MSKVLITGITGFIGSNLASVLEKESFEVIGSTNSPEKINTTISHLDFSNEDSLTEWISEFQPDSIVHTAAITNVMHNDLSEIYRTNVIYTENLLNAIARSCSKKVNVIVASTAGVYGNNQSENIEETSLATPNNHYSYSKLIVEHLCSHYRDKFNINIVRPFNIIGKGQRDNFLIPKLASRYANKVDNVPLGNIDAVRDYLSIDDCVRVLKKMILNNSQLDGPVNICSGVGHSARDAMNVLEKISGHKLDYFINPDFVRKNEIWRLVGCPKKLNNVVNESSVVTATFEDIVTDIYIDYLSKVS